LRAAVRLLVAAVALTACADGGGDTAHYAEDGLALEIPEGWSVTGFSTTVFPRRLVAASFPVELDDVEGDCGGLAAVERLPSDGAYVVIVDYGEWLDPRWSPNRFPVRSHREGQLAEFECFGRSWMFRFVIEGRDVQVHVGLGRRADPHRADEALALVNSLSVAAPR
jgi:hypothetical protein